jgi:hypothetical protein
LTGSCGRRSSQAEPDRAADGHTHPRRRQRAPRSGKTTLAKAIARALPCLAICRDEIKEGMVQPDLAKIVAFVNRP